jgi:spore germination protein
MDIYVVQPGDSIYSIAENHGVSVERLIQDNEITNPDSLVPGQTIVILYPLQTHTVQEGDTLEAIVEAYGITLNQLLRNNPFLSDREYIYPGEILVIRYNTQGEIAVNGYANVFIRKDILHKTLPSLTYLSIFNYQTTSAGEIISFGDDTELIRTAKEYGVAPLMVLTTLTSQGEANLQTAFDILINEEYQNQNINNILDIMRDKGYYGVNISFLYINTANYRLYESFLNNISNRLNSEGYHVFLAVNPNITYENSEVSFERVDYSVFTVYADGTTFIEYKWGFNFGPPLPVTSVYGTRELLNYVLETAPPERINIGVPMIGYDWELPYVFGFSRANSLTLASCLTLANYEGAVIQFDEISQTPFFEYVLSEIENPVQHIVWFVDARTFDALLNLISELGLAGASVWNIMTYNPQLWLVINGQFEVERVLP